MNLIMTGVGHIYIQKYIFEASPIDYSEQTCIQPFNPIALRKAKIVCNFGLSECSRVKVNYRYTARRSNLAIFIFASNLKGSAVKEKNLLLRKPTGSHKNCFPCINMPGILRDVPIYLMIQCICKLS